MHKKTLLSFIEVGEQVNKLNIVGNKKESPLFHRGHTPLSICQILTCMSSNECNGRVVNRKAKQVFQQGSHIVDFLYKHIKNKYIYINMNGDNFHLLGFLSTNIFPSF